MNKKFFSFLKKKTLAKETFCRVVFFYLDTLVQRGGGQIIAFYYFPESETGKEFRPGAYAINYHGCIGLEIRVFFLPGGPCMFFKAKRFMHDNLAGLLTILAVGN
ncbi:hypothetical protein ACJX0J_034757, partial [Zea mays]